MGFGGWLVLSGSCCFGEERIRLDIQDDYFVGESLQIRLILPPSVKQGWMLLQSPDGKLTSLLPNEFESLVPGHQHSRKRLFPDPSSAYQVLLERVGSYRVWSIHLPAEGDQSLIARWPQQLPGDFPTALQELRTSVGSIENSSAMVYSHLDFMVNAGERSPTETLDLKDGILDGNDNPVFLPNQTRLATAEDYRTLWKWARLMNSPAHRHQCFLIECHATTAGSRKANLALSESRAKSIVEYLIERCHIPEERLTANGKGDFEPLPGQPPESSAHNRIALALDNTAGARTF